jgi:hypothetical protein
MESLAAQPSIVSRPENTGLYVVPDISEEMQAYSVRDAEYELETQARFNQWMGSLAVHTMAEVVDAGEEQPGVNLLERLRLAKTDSPEGREALNMVDINIAKAVYEVCFKENHVTTTSMHRDKDGNLIQFGQTADSVYRNAITERPNRHSKLQEITRIEALNGHRIDDALKAGVLKGHYFVVASIVPEGVPEEDLGPDGDGYFLDGLTFVIQATTEQSNGNILTKSGFMAGVEADENDSFEQKVAKRFDIKVLSLVYQRLGLEPPRTAAGFLNNGIYIPKEMMPNGVVDFMRWCAEASDEVLGRDIERKPEDFMAIELASKRREASLKDVCLKVREDLLSTVDELEAPMEAIQRMWDFVKEHATRDSFRNPNIDPKVFGRAAAPYIEKVRQEIKNGTGNLQDYMRKALELSIITGCGGGSSAPGGGAFGGGSYGVFGESSTGSDRFGSLKFECPQGHVNVRKPNELIPNCTTCGTSVQC